ncbi:MAG: septum formation initiator family protein [Desulfobacteraceae bacterium]|nr:septum formation initiator family protein [Desulfobacteraceae bacterium]MBC2719461.1 septum formation initiator family protein [Desulfobacteraceae bacterium]
MSLKQKILFSLSIMILFSLLLFIIFGDNGLFDFNLLKREKYRLIEKNVKINMDNLSLYREIDRLEHDSGYIEDVVRRELCLIAENEVIFKFNGEHKVKK